MMRQIDNQIFLPRWFYLIAFCVFVSLLNGCAVLQPAQEKSWTVPAHTVKEIERNKFSVARGDDVIGRLAVVTLGKDETLPDIARHFGAGVDGVGGANPKVDMWAPEKGDQVLLPLSFILPDAARKGIVINLASMRLFQYKGDGSLQTVMTYPVGVGAEDRPTPMGPTRVVRKAVRPTWYVPASIAERHRKKGDILPAKVPPGPDNPLGEYALYLSKAGYLIHGTNKPASVGLQATNGCIRLYPENIKILFNDTPVETPVTIVNQPYLIGQRGGVLYMEAHDSKDNSAPGELRKIHDKLRSIEKKLARKLDWKKIDEVQAEKLGIPIPIFELKQGSEKNVPKTVRVERPYRLYGKPEIPEMRMNAWYIQAASVRNEMNARRLAAMINHQGPPIPARVLPKSDGGYRVVAGPFKDSSEANEAAKRLKFDLEIDGIPFNTLK